MGLWMASTNLWRHFHDLDWERLLMFYEWGADTDVSVTAAMVWPVTLVVDAVYGPEK
jgi:hypothetical protein